MYSTSIIFDRKKQAEGDREGALEVRVTVDRKSYYINTGVRVQRKQWAGIVIRRADADALNNRLAIIVRRVSEKVNEFIEKQQPLDMNAVKSYIYSGSSAAVDNNGLLTWIEKEIPMLNVSEKTRKHYWLLLDRLKAFGRLKAWTELTVENIYEWDAWLHQMANVNSKDDEGTLSNGTIHNYHKHLKAMLHRALDFGIIEATPYARLVGKFDRGEDENVEYLTEEEMQLILDSHPVPGTQMETVRDLFIIQMFTGLAYSDMQALDIKNYHREGDAWVSNGKRIKTGVPFVSQLLPPVVEVLERHGWQVPQMPNQKYNAQLKTFGNAIGIEGLHSHLARHTFATYMLSNNVKLQNVMKMMGHRKIEQTMRYAKVLAKDVHEDYGMIADKLKGNTRH
jgi:integrase